MSLGIEGKLAVVIGASKGLGREVALDLTGHGCRVVAVARSERLLQSMALGVEGGYVVADVVKAQPAMLAAEIKSRFGEPDIIYYAIGGSYGGIKDSFAPSSEWQKVWQYNLGVAVDLNRHFVPRMKEQKWGRIVFTSTDGIRRNIGYAPYIAAKCALEGYVGIVSRELAQHNVVMSAVAPGPIYTEGRWLYSQPKEWTDAYLNEHVGAKRFGDAREAAKVVTFLCSDAASYMAGSIVRVDGGSR